MCVLWIRWKSFHLVSIYSFFFFISHSFHPSLPPPGTRKRATSKCSSSTSRQNWRADRRRCTFHPRASSSETSNPPGSFWRRQSTTGKSPLEKNSSGRDDYDNGSNIPSDDGMTNDNNDYTLGGLWWWLLLSVTFTCFHFSRQEKLKRLAEKFERKVSTFLPRFCSLSFIFIFLVELFIQDINVN